MDAAVRRIGLQAIPWMDQPALVPVGSAFRDLSPKVAWEVRKVGAIVADYPEEARKEQ
jgi:hypothetical protein